MSHAQLNNNIFEFQLNSLEVRQSWFGTLAGMPGFGAPAAALPIMSNLLNKGRGNATIAVTSERRTMPHSGANIGVSGLKNDYGTFKTSEKNPCPAGLYHSPPKPKLTQSSETEGGTTT
jgi:hypothetical protein